MEWGLVVLSHSLCAKGAGAKRRPPKLANFNGRFGWDPGAGPKPVMPAVGRRPRAKPLPPVVKQKPGRGHASAAWSLGNLTSSPD